MVVDDGLHADRGGDVCLAGTWATDEHDVLGIVEELTAMQGLHLADTNAAFVEVEALRDPGVPGTERSSSGS